MEPFFEKTRLFVAGQGGYFCYRIPALVVSTHGTILAFCEARKNDCADWDAMDLVVRRSTDGGKSWDAPRVVIEGGTESVNQPCPVADRDTGMIWLPFCKNNQQVFVTSSADDGLTWSSPIEITAQVKDPTWHYVGSGPGHGIQLKSGRLLIPSWGDLTPSAVTWKPAPNWDAVEFSYAFYSDDHGATWTRGDIFDLDTSDECEAVEASDGAVYMNMRSRQGKHRRAFAWSHDGGETWTPVQFDDTLPEPGCQGSVVRLSDAEHHDKNRVLLAHPAGETERVQLTVRVSYDECQTWARAQVIEQGAAGYCDLAVARDGTILCLYEANQQFAGRNPFDLMTIQELATFEADSTFFANISRESALTLARFNLEWLERAEDRN